MVKNDTYFMKFALSQAKLAKENNEVPVGAVIVYENNIILRDILYMLFIYFISSILYI